MVKNSTHFSCLQKYRTFLVILDLCKYVRLELHKVLKKTYHYRECSSFGNIMWLGKPQTLPKIH